MYNISLVLWQQDFKNATGEKESMVSYEVKMRSVDHRRPFAFDDCVDGDREIRDASVAIAGKEET